MEYDNLISNEKKEKNLSKSFDKFNNIKTDYLKKKYLII